MPENIIRQDIIQIGFETNLKELQKITGSLDEIKKNIGGVGKEDGLDKLRKSADKGTSSISKLNSGLIKVGKSVGSVAKKAAGLTFKGTVAGIGAATTALGGLAAAAVSSYGEFEQLKGGVETLFGAKGAQNVEEYAKYVGKSVGEVQDKYNELKDVEATVLKNANNAYKTAGLSANDYMNTVTTFSSALINSLGGDTKKAADLADVALKDMADNANKMGTDMGSIQIVYSGLARGIYTTLDNLKLGKPCRIAQYKPCENGETLMLCA